MKRRVAILLSVLAGVGVAWACRYSVRDTGFVDLGDENYQLILEGRDLDDRAEVYRRIAAASLLDANITLVVREDPDAGEPSLTLRAQDGRTFVLARGETLPADVPRVTTLIEAVALSPLRAEIHEAALNAFAVVVLIEGGRPAEMSRVQAAIEAAMRNVERLMPGMPKPVDTPPVLIRVPAGQLADERVTLWGLGFDPEPADEPRVALVFGRGRRIGSPLEGPLITQTVVQERLVIVGQDCECELDREWMKGPLLPARWDAGRQQQALRNLGFDPENPMVRAEVSRIVLRGPVTGQVKKLAGTALDFGYAEVSLDDLPAEDGAMELDAAESEMALEEPAEADTATLAVAVPLERTRLFSWFILSGSSLAVLVFAGMCWRKIRREQG
jgi:hypothetical protein